MLITLTSPTMEVRISPLGAELVEWRDEEGRDLLWNGDPTFWTGRSPLLFPVVGRLKNDRLRVEGAEYELKQHGFARTSLFEVVETGPPHCRLVLRSSDATLKHYPFDFALEVSYRLAGSTLAINAVIRNPGQRPMPASFGFHPAFRWPLRYGGEREAHEIRFEHPEPEPIRLLQDGLLGGSADWTPIEGDRLPLRDKLFEEGALVFDKVASRAVTYGVPGRRSIKVAFPEMPHLGIWTKPGAGFLCIEPWQGYASPYAFDGELAEKPGMVVVGPGESRVFRMEMSAEKI